MTEDKAVLEANENDKVNFVVVGCGRMGATNDDNVQEWAVAQHWLPLSHASAIEATEQARLIAVCDVNETAAAQAGRRYRVPYYFDYRQMLLNENFQALTVATRTQGRKEIITAAVLAGIKGIYCEKPLCNTLEDADCLVNLLNKKNTAFVYGTRRRFMSVYNSVRDSINNGEIGELTTIVIKFGYGLLFWGHPHSVDIASFFANDEEIEYVQAELSLKSSSITKTKGTTIVDDDPKVHFATIKFINGVTAHIVAGLSFDVDLLGTQGTVSVRSDGASVHWRKNSTVTRDEGWLLAEQVVNSYSQSSGTVNSMKALSNAILRAEYPNYDIGLAAKNQEALFGFVYSHLDEGRKVYFPIRREGFKITGRYGKFFA